MKKCPYCAEEIMDEAIFCRYCTRRVRGRYNRLIFFAIIMAIIASICIKHKVEIGVFFKEMGSVCQSIKEIVRDLPESLKNMKNYNFIRVEDVENIIDRTPNDIK